MRLDMLAGSGCGAKAKHNADYLYNVQSQLAGKLLLYWAVWRIHPLIIVIGESKATWKDSATCAGLTHGHDQSNCRASERK